MAGDTSTGNFLMNLLKKIPNNSNQFVITHLSSIVFVVQLILVFGGEELLQYLLKWKCPSSHEIALRSGILFFVAPAIVALLLSFPLHWKNWRLCHGCCRKAEDVKGIPVTALERLTIFYKILIGPVFWIVACFFDGGYYACMVQCEDTEENCQEKLIADSRMIAWIIVILFIAIGCFCKAVVHCCSSTSFDCWQYHGLHQNAVKDILLEEMKAHAQEAGKVEVEEMIKVVTTAYDELPSGKKGKENLKIEELSSEELIKKS